MGVEVLEVDRPDRQKRRRSGKSDPVEAIRVLVVAKRSVRQARGKALVQMRHLGYSAPDSSVAA